MRHDRRKNWQASAAATAGLLCGGWAMGAIPACGYDVEIVAFDCGYPLGKSGTFGNGLAPNGTIVGSFWDCDLSFHHAFLWPPGGSMQIVPYPPRVYSMELFDVNDAGQGVGTLFEEDGYWSEAFRLDQGRVIPLGVLPGAIASEALAMNAHGIAVGWSGFSARLPRHAVVWELDGRIIDVGADLGTPESEATDVTDSGLVTGWMGTSSLFGAIPYIWDADKITTLPLLPERGAFSTRAQAINERKNVCGEGFGAMPNGLYARAYAYIDGRALSLGVLPGYENSGANDLNIHNQIVGSCSSSTLAGGAFIWDQHVMLRLTELIDPKLELKIEYANAISDSGVIAGVAVDMSGDAFAIRLIPRARLDADFDCDGKVGPVDLQQLIGLWGDCPKKTSCIADLNSDGTVNGFDLAILLGDWD